MGPWWTRDRSGRSSVGDDVLRARYEVSPSWQIQVRHIVFLAERTASDSARTEAREAAEAALARVEAGETSPRPGRRALPGRPGAADRGGSSARPGGGTGFRSSGRAAALEPGEVAVWWKAPTGTM